MSLTSVHNDASTVRQEIADSRNIYSYQANPVAYYRPYPIPQARGVFVNQTGNGQAFVDAESLLRNQSFLSSADPEYRAQADTSFAPYMNPPAISADAASCVQQDLAPRVQYHSRACDPLSGLTIDRFDILHHKGEGFKYGYADFGQDTVAAFKDQLEKQRVRQ
jgi:hypothetical protein